MRDEKNYKIFISYSWTTPEHEDKVLELAKRLVNDGVDVVLDKWDLKEGQDKYAFMEQMVTDNNIIKVLLICDKGYKEKANMRKGGVGDETIIISSELYGKVDQQKFIPVIFEFDNNGPCCPVYVKSRLYIDLSECNTQKYEIEYEKLLRIIYDKRIYVKPPLGKKPEWIRENLKELSPIRDIIKQIKYCSDLFKLNILIKEFIELYVKVIQSYIINENITNQLMLNFINKTRQLRDLYIDFLSSIIYKNVDISDIVCKLMQDIYNNGKDLHLKVVIQNDIEELEYHVWELILCTVTFLYYYERYKEIYDIFTATYFLRNKKQAFNIEAKNINSFCCVFENLKEYKNRKNSFYVAGDILVSQEYLPIITQESLSLADIILYHLSAILFDNDKEENWFPRSFIHNKHARNEFQKFKSRKFCEKVAFLFGTENVQEMKNKIELYKPNVIFKKFYNFRDYRECPTILESVNINEIASLN